MIYHWLQSIIGLAVMGMLFPFPAMAFVSPDQVAVLVNAQSSENLDLATYYMQRRGIPLGNRVDLDLPLTDSINREVYEQEVLKPVRESLMKKALGNRIKVLVTIYGMPLRVHAPRLTTKEDEWIADAGEWGQSALELLGEQEQDIVKQKASLSQSPQPSGNAIFSLAETVKNISSSQVRTWGQQLIEVLNKLHHEIESKDTVEEKETLRASRAQIIRRIFGKVGAKADIEGIPRLTVEEQRQEASVQQILAGLMRRPSAATRTQAYALVQEAYGLWGILAFAQWEVERYQQTDASASLDSELSFLWWESGTYPLAGRLPNPFYYGYSGQVGDWPLPLLLVSRLDAPTPAHVRGMIDQAIATEIGGLRGNVYVDARGQKKGPPLSYGFYDADMQDFAKIFRSVANYPLTLENTEQRFDTPGQAPNVALYVGWYRLRHYEDAFTFNPGAIGYHIASGEAVSIHHPKELGWCKNALERGITVTLGPVGEPYLDAFPLPTEFFGLLYSGKYSLVEAYYLSVRYLSWKMVLFGDPLYRPWFKPDVAQQKAAQTLLQNRPFPISPTQVVFPVSDAVQDHSKFPGKYVSFDSLVLTP